MRVIPITDIPNVLSGDEAFTAVCRAWEDLIILKTFEIVHGRERGIARYIEAGRQTRFNDAGEPVILWPESSDA